MAISVRRSESTRDKALSVQADGRVIAAVRKSGGHCLRVVTKTPRGTDLWGWGGGKDSFRTKKQQHRFIKRPFYVFSLCMNVHYSQNFIVKLWRQFMAGWLTRWAVNPVTECSTPGHDTARDRFSVLPSQHSSRFTCAYLAFVCTARTKIVKDLVSIFP